MYVMGCCLHQCRLHPPPTLHPALHLAHSSQHHGRRPALSSRAVHPRAPAMIATRPIARSTTRRPSRLPASHQIAARAPFPPRATTVMSEREGRDDDARRATPLPARCAAAAQERALADTWLIVVSPPAVDPSSTTVVNDLPPHAADASVPPLVSATATPDAKDMLPALTTSKQRHVVIAVVVVVAAALGELDNDLPTASASPKTDGAIPRG